MTACQSGTFKPGISEILFPTRALCCSGSEQRISISRKGTPDDSAISRKLSRTRLRSFTESDCIAFIGQVTGLRLACFPSVSEDAERISGEPRHAVVSPIHNELNAFRCSAKFSSNEFVANTREVIKDIALDVFCAFRVIIIRKITDDDVGFFHPVFCKTNL